MKRSLSISAFTLTEILVVLVISTIVVGLAFTVLDLVQRNLAAIRKNFEANSEMRHLEQQLTLDFNRYHNIRYNEELKEMHLSTPIDTIVYFYSEGGALVRNLDTIDVPLKKLNFFFEGNKVIQGNVDALKIFLNRPDKKFLFIYKENSAKTFFN